MSKALIIAEKPSVAGDIAKVLGKFKKDKDFYENDDYVISSAIGHLVEISAGDADPKRGKWNIDNLPVVPARFALNPIERTEARFKLLKKLAARKDVDSLINACDAGREGELIFRYIVQLAKIQKPVRRLWLQSMTPDSIRSGFRQLRSDEEMQPLAAAAQCRSEADWLIGINGTRALTSFNSKGGGFNKTTVGRVQTPTLAVLVKREEQIRRFQPRPFWEIHATFGAAAGDYAARWFDENFKKSAADDDEGSERRLEKAERIWTRAQADAIVSACAGLPGIVEEKSKPTTQLSPLLFDLTSLQREANGRFGFPARMTLSIAQSLYEKHKALTYPRTDSRYLPEDYLPTVSGTLRHLPDPLAPFAQKITASGWVRPNKRIFNNAKISDHFAIIPTPDAPNLAKLSETELKIYTLVARRFMAVFYPPAVFEVTTRITRVGEHAFKTEGKVLKEAGWLVIYGREEQAAAAGPGADADHAPALPPVADGEQVAGKNYDLIEDLTRPPARFSEATLLSAMEGAGKLVADDELREAMSEKGLGTPATRAAIIEGLIFEKYVERNGRELKPTVKAFDLLETLETLKIDALSSPELTGEWEYKLKQIEYRKLTRPEFMKEIENMTRDTIERIRRGGDPAEVVLHNTELIDPFSGKKMLKTLKNFRAEDNSFAVPKIIAGRVMAEDEVRELLEQRVVGPLDDFKNRMGRAFSAYVRLNDNKEITLDWGAVGADSEEAAPDFSGQEPLGICPATGRRVFETANAYVTEPAEGEKRSGKEAFRMSRKILEQEISREQVIKLLKERKTDLLTHFISRRTRRPFKAYLVLQDDGKTGFEFPPREAKPPGGAARKSPSKKSAR
ncbi:MAG: DNA topoisomerase III [Verrucomicrobiales bacterium]|jgi:DNA topoisomerase-3|nr:DNA topoisomerase III [Verrucomicrobiales bacterium]